MESPGPCGPVGLYLHFPFCAARCSYCDFATEPDRDDGSVEAYLQALEREIRGAPARLPRNADTVYVGGGTPSRMHDEQLERLLQSVRQRFELAADVEITLEANPENVTDGQLERLRRAGVTRISIGLQSLDDAVLRRVGRTHSAAQGLQAVRRARADGIPRVGVDLIAGLPGEALGDWSSTVRRALEGGPDHVSVYLLETDKHAPLQRGLREGRIRGFDDEALIDAYRRTVETLQAGGFAQYEISNFARPGCQSRHNVKYWTDKAYLGFGTAAHSYCGGERWANRRDLAGYLAAAAAGRSPVAWRDPWNRERRAGEALLLGLRHSAGVDLDELSRRYGIDLGARFAAAWRRAGDAGLIARQGDRIRLTSAGMLRSNELFVEFV